MVGGIRNVPDEHVGVNAREEAELQTCLLGAATVVCCCGCIVCINNFKYTLHSFVSYLLAYKNNNLCLSNFLERLSTLLQQIFQINHQLIISF